MYWIIYLQEIFQFLFKNHKHSHKLILLIAALEEIVMIIFLNTYSIRNKNDLISCWKKSSSYILQYCIKLSIPSLEQFSRYSNSNNIVTCLFNSPGSLIHIANERINFLSNAINRLSSSNCCCPSLNEFFVT